MENDKLDNINEKHKKMLQKLKFRVTSCENLFTRNRNDINALCFIIIRFNKIDLLIRTQPFKRLELF